MEEMMKNGKTIVAVALSLAVGMSAALAFGVEVNIGPENITLQTEAARKPAVFPHRRHQEGIVCTACHHADGEMMTVEKCESCHNKDFDDGKLNGFKKVAHIRCKECHKAVNQDQGKAAPIKCTGCHVQ